MTPDTPTSDTYAVILAGGSGERFWPLSRKASPKQLLRLFSDKTLLENTLFRLEDVVPPERILVLTNTEQEQATRRVLSGLLPEENIVAEPAKRDTAPAVALGVAWVAAHDANGVMAVLPADHLIEDTATFCSNLADAFAAARSSGGLVTLGIRPTWPCPSFGYIESGEPMSVPGVATRFSRVRSFREKPSVERAEQFLSQANFFWNAGMFVWSVSAIHCELAAHAPPLADFVHRTGHGGGNGRLAKGWENAFPSLPKISVDYAVMEKAGNVLVLEAEFDWDDVGGWVAVAKYLRRDSQENASNTSLLARDASGNIVHAGGGKQVALLGVRDLIVVDTGDALLVASRSEAERIKQLVPDLPETLQ